MEQRRIDDFFKRRKEESKLLTLIKAKKGDKNALLIEHVSSALKRCVELYTFIGNLGDTLTYEPFTNPQERNKWFKSLAKAIILHDLGKVSLDFQMRLYGKEKLPQELWEFLGESGGVKTYGNHEVFSVFWTAALLKDSEEDRKIRSAILLHHYNEFFSGDKEVTAIVEQYPEDVLKYLNFLASKKEGMSEFLKTCLSEIKGRFPKGFILDAVRELEQEMDFSCLKELKEKIESWEDDPGEIIPIYNPAGLDVDFLVFLGMLRRCDYSSSGDFEIETVKNIESVFGNIEKKVNKKIQEKAGESFKGLWQEELLNKNDSDYLTVIAPTGSGKTELGVLWTKRRGKLIYTLPLRVALNDLYQRLSQEYFDDGSVGLLHSTAFMEYVEGAGTEIDIEKKVNSARLLAMPVMLSTPDQVFLTGLNYYGSDKVVSVYPESAIVVDEVQAYTPEMVAVFLRTLQLVRQAGGKVLIITATLPPHIKWYLSGFTADEAEKYNVDIGELPESPFDFQFKVVDVAEEFKGKEEKVKNLAIKRHRIAVVEASLFEYQQGEKTNRLEPIFKGKENVLKKITEEFEPNGLRTVIIVVNNVKKAIKTYEELKDELQGNWEVKLLHSRLPEKKKQKTIGEVKRLLEEHRGYRNALKNGNMPDNKPKPLLLITTQVVEASVDADFDAMITEISPIDSQVQRWGRVYRNRAEDYSTDTPNVVIFSGIDRGTLAVYGGGIGKSVLERTLEVLKEIENKPLDYRAERDAIDMVYSGEILERYINEVNNIFKKLNYFTLEKKSEAQSVFRQMGGMYFVVPALMIEYGYSGTVKKFGELLDKPENLKLSWRDIVQKVYGLREELSQKELNNKKLELKKILQEFSVNVPTWFVLRDSHLQHALHNTFKGYPVVLTWDKKITEKLWKYGVDEALDEDLDVNEDVL
ncbi:CRISPR-associated helicase Cas3' [Thermococcus atlanticus]